jgi:DNA mismatch endonuclease (patch repair protein)
MPHAFSQRPVPSSAGVSERMKRVRRRDTAPELRLRSELHRRGLRYRVDAPVSCLPRKRVDIVFSPARLAVYVDGCFWHSCPAHGQIPRANREWWSEKLAAVRRRDVEATTALEAAGWGVLRFWEHEDPVVAADAVVAALAARRIFGRYTPLTATVQR